jgi:hypothetical protein
MKITRPLDVADRKLSFSIVLALAAPNEVSASSSY